MTPELSLRQLALQASSFAPKQLFKPADRGILLDPSVLSSLTQDAAGTTPVTAAGQPVGRIMDLSGLVNHATQSVPAARPTYQIDSGGRPYLLFDGLDDRMITPTIALSAAGRTVISAVRKNSDATQGAIIEHRPAWTTAGGIAQFAPGSNGAATLGSRSQTSATQSIINSPASYAAPMTAVLSTVAQTGSHIMRINGAQVAADTPAGSMAALSAGLSIGARDNGAGLIASIRLYVLLLIDRVLTATELARAEKWLAAKCGVTI